MDDAKFNGASGTGFTKLTIRLPVDVHRALKIESAERRISMADLIVEALTSGGIRFLPRSLRQEPKNEPESGNT